MKFFETVARLAEVRRTETGAQRDQELNNFRIIYSTFFDPLLYHLAIFLLRRINSVNLKF